MYPTSLPRVMPTFFDPTIAPIILAYTSLQHQPCSRVTTPGVFWEQFGRFRLQPLLPSQYQVCCPLHELRTTISPNPKHLFLESPEKVGRLQIKYGSIARCGHRSQRVNTKYLGSGNGAVVL
jgi:hypothetical protein